MFEWYVPEEKLPPYNIPVMLHIKFKYCGVMHTYGWLEPDGWHMLADVKDYFVEKWRYF